MRILPNCSTTRASDAYLIFQYALQAVDAYTLTRKALRLEGDSLFLPDATEIHLPALRHLYVVGAGKAVAPMAKAVEEVLGNRITSGAITTKYDHALPLEKIQVTEAGHPVPDANGLRGTTLIVDMLAQTQAQDLVLVLLSGGGSALLADVPPACTLEDVQHCFDLLLRSGAAIDEMNTVRKHLSAIKGGQLARLAAPARVVTLLISDVIGDSLEVIASGPSVPDTTTFADAWQVINKYQLATALPPSIRTHLTQGLDGRIADTPAPTEAFFAQVTHCLIGNNTQALEAAAAKARQLGYQTHIRTHTLSGEAHEQAVVILEDARKVASGKPTGQPCCLLYGGETTVTIRGTGKGGRNQEMALAAAIQLHGIEGVMMLCAGTDGTDGPTDVAGAWVDGHTLDRAGVSVEEARQWLDDNNSYAFFAQTEGHIRTGATHTNVMDLYILCIENNG